MCRQLLNARDLFRTLKFIFVSTISALRGSFSLSESITPDGQYLFVCAAHKGA